MARVPSVIDARGDYTVHSGATKRYGFGYVNRDETDLLDLRRVRKDSFAWYRSVIATNGLPGTVR